MNEPPNSPILMVSPSKKKYTSPILLFTITIAGVFLAEVASMIVIYLLQPAPYWVETLLDATIMTALIFPLIYIFPFRGLSKEIGERKRSEALLSNVLESLPVGVWIIGRNGDILDGNTASRKIWAGACYVGIEQYGEYKGWRAGSGERIEANEWAVVRAVNQGETTLDEEIDIECFDGSRKTILNSAIPIYQEGQIDGAIVVNQDITERRQMELDIQRSEALFRTVFKILPVGAWITDKDGKIIYGNPTGQEIWAGARYVGIEQFGEYKGWWLNSGKQIQAEEWAVARAIRNGETSVDEEIEIECFDGSHKYILNSAIPFLDDHDQLLGVFVVNQDITEHKMAELKLLQQNQELVELSSAEHRMRVLSESLVQTMLVVNASLELGEVMKAILEQIRRVVPCQCASITLVDNDLLEIVAISRFPHQVEFVEKSYRLDDYPFLLEILRTQSPVLIDDISELPEQALFSKSDCGGSYLGAPLFVGKRVIGIINLSSAQPMAFDLETVNRLTVFTTPAAVAIENARLFAAEQDARHLAETMNAMSLALTKTLDLETVIEILIDYVYRIVPSDRAYIVLKEDDTNLVLRAEKGYEREHNSKLALNASFDSWEISYLHKAIATKTSLLIRNTKNYPEWETLISQEVMGSWLGVPILVASEVLGVLALAKTTPEFYSFEQVYLVETIVNQAAIAIQNAGLFEQVRSSKERLQSLARSLVEVQERERSSIARELHDEAGQALSSLKLNLSRLEQDPECSPRFSSRLVELKALTDGVLEGLHRLAMDLRPIALDHLGLVAALQQYTRNYNDEGLSIKFKALGFETDRLAPDIEISLYRIVQEALTNVVRHANASNVGVLLERGGGKVKVFIEDNGVGLELNSVDLIGHMGLVGMRERAEMLGGSLTLESSIGKGTAVIVEVPDGNSDSNR